MDLDDAGINEISKKYEKYWKLDDNAEKKKLQIKMTEHLLKTNDIEYYSSKHPEESVQKIFKSFTYEIIIKGEIDEVNKDKTPTSNILDYSQWTTKLYDKLLEIDEIDEIKIKNKNNYVVIDLTSELLLLYNTDKETNKFVPKLLNNININNIFGIEFMIKRYYQNIKNAKLGELNTLNLLYLINSRIAFDKCMFNTLVKELFNEKNYSGSGTYEDTDKDKDTLSNNKDIDRRSNFKEGTTNYSILYYLNKFITEYKKKIKDYNVNKKICNNLEETTNECATEYDGTDKHIFLIGDIHGDFPRFVQILYNAKFIKFEGSKWISVNLLDETSVKEYMHSPELFMEVVWLPKNTLLLSTGDLVDSLRSGGNADDTGDYELRIHLLILILREQAIQKNSFIHFILGNHDITLLFNEISPETSKKSLNKIFKSSGLRYSVLNYFYIFISLYAYIKLQDNEYIFMSHASLIKSINDNKITKPDNFKLEYNAYDNFINKHKNIYLLRNTFYLINFKNNDCANIKVDEKNIEINNEEDIDSINLIKIYNYINNLTNNINSKDKYNTLIDDIKFNIIDIINEDTCIKKFIKDDELTYITNKLTDDTDLKKKSEKIFEILSKIKKEISIELTAEQSEWEKSISYKEILSINPEIKCAVFGHQVTTTKTVKEFINHQTNGLENHHTILSTCGGKVNFIDTALSMAFGIKNNNFYELFYYPKAKTGDITGRLRIYTDSNRYILGAPQPPEIFMNNDNNFIPKLDDGNEFKFD